MSDLVVVYPELLINFQDFLLTPTSMTLKFYSNNYTPSKSSVVGDFTQANDGISGLPLTWLLAQADWSFSTDADGYKAVQPQISAVIGGTLNVYGYWVVDNSGTLKWAQRFDGAPVSFPSGLSACIFTPEIHCDSP